MAERRRSAHAGDDQNNGGTLSAKQTRDQLSSYLYRSVHIGQCYHSINRLWCYARSSNNKWQAKIPARRHCGWVTDLFQTDGLIRCQWLNIAYVKRELAAW